MAGQYDARDMQRVLKALNEAIQELTSANQKLNNINLSGLDGEMRNAIAKQIEKQKTSVNAMKTAIQKSISDVQCKIRALQ